MQNNMIAKNFVRIAFSGAPDGDKKEVFKIDERNV